MGIVRGRALFVRRWGNLPGAEGLGAAAWARAYADAGLAWACVACAWGGEVNVNRTLDRWHALRDAGIDTWALWGLPTPMASITELGGRTDAVLEWCHRARVTGIVPDPEKKDGEGRDLHWDRYPERAELLARKCRNSGLRYGVTSYGAPRGVRRFPFAEFLTGAELIIPQTYDAELRFDPTYGARALRDYRALGAVPDSTFAMGVGTWNKTEHRRKSDAELTRHLSLTLDLPIIAWPHGTLTASELRIIATAPLGTDTREPRRRRPTSLGPLGWILGTLTAAFFADRG
jgi:hypothetical protein